MTSRRGPGGRPTAEASSPASATDDAPVNPSGVPPLSPDIPSGSDARADWFARIGRRSVLPGADEESGLPPPGRLELQAGVGHVTLRWDRVPGAVGYLVHRARSPDGPFTIVDHGGGDLLCVPHMAYADTTGEPAVEAWYAVSSVAGVEQPTGRLSGARSAAPLAAGPATVRLRVDATARTGALRRPWRPIVGSERLSLLLRGRGPGGSEVGKELATALRMAREELGVASVRAHAILHDELGVVHGSGDSVAYDFSAIDAIYDRLLGIGLRPVVELSFMPRSLARDPDTTVFDYRAIVSPPRDLGDWGRLVSAFVEHLIDRYGRDEIAAWAFEVWNEPNLEVFWTGTLDDYFALYETTAAAIKAVDPGLRVGGPATAAAGWVGEMLERTRGSGVSLDFLATHCYGSPPLDIAQIAAAHGRDDLPVWWTEWGVTPTHFAPVNDSVFAAPFVLRSMKLAGELHIDALAYWVISDHFEELGGPPRLFHGGFGLLSVGNMRKPRYWALALLERLDDALLDQTLEGDGAGSLVDAIATIDEAGGVRVLVWNGTLDQSKVDGDPRLARTVELRVGGLPSGAYVVGHHRVDQWHSNIVASWQAMGGGKWPDVDAWRALRERDVLDELEPERVIEPTEGAVALVFELPMPGVSSLVLEPLADGADRRSHPDDATIEVAGIRA